MVENKKQNLIGLSGRSGNGKDLVAAIIQYLITTIDVDVDFHTWYKSPYPNLELGRWKIRKYADKLKDIICILLGCTREQLEDRGYKETPLGPEWNRYEVLYLNQSFMFNTLEDAENWYNVNNSDLNNIRKPTLIEMTPRKLLQIVGTECGREIIHPNLWINALFADYKPYSKGVANTKYDITACYYHTACNNCGNSFLQHKRARFCDECILDDSFQIYPDWIISDVRFPHNEGKAITDRGGINIGIKRKFGLRVEQYAHLENLDNPYEIPIELRDINGELYKTLTHESEELMGDFDWCDYVIENNGTIEELIDKVREILIKENVIK